MWLLVSKSSRAGTAAPRRGADVLRDRWLFHRFDYEFTCVHIDGDVHLAARPAGEAERAFALDEGVVELAACETKFYGIVFTLAAPRVGIPAGEGCIEAE